MDYLQFMVLFIAILRSLAVINAGEAVTYRRGGISARDLLAAGFVHVCTGGRGARYERLGERKAGGQIIESVLALGGWVTYTRSWTPGALMLAKLQRDGADLDEYHARMLD
jgi:hypothetical protein